jgi:hypothetical protein
MHTYSILGLIVNILKVWNGVLITVRTVTLKKLDVRNQKINVTFQKINGTSPKMNVPVCPEILSFGNTVKATPKGG